LTEEKSPLLKYEEFLLKVQTLDVFTDSKNTFHGNEYLTLQGMFAQTVDLREQYQITVQYKIMVENDTPYLTVYVKCLGEFVDSSVWPLPELPAKPQEMGSLLSYYKRYLTFALWNINPLGEDDDGEAAHGRTQSSLKPPSGKKPQARVVNLD
jgi:hypothetical protein